jgi:hypothetical protein
VSEDTLIQRLEQELEQIQELVIRTHKLLDKVRQTGDEDYLNAVALYLHSFYTAAERIFYLLAKEIDDSVPAGADWHKQLLEQMVVEIPNIRQQVISDQTFLELDEFRRFRHVVRSLYAYKLDPKRILVLAEKLSTAGEHLMEDCQRLFVAVRRSSSLDEPNLNESSIDRSLEE